MAIDLRALDIEPIRALYRPPELTHRRWVVPVSAPPEAMEVGVGEMLRQFAEVDVATGRPLEHAAEVIMARGYSPRDCLLETCNVGGPFDTRIVLKVCGEPVFEVTRTSDGDLAKDLKINLTITARWLSMPPLRDVRTEPIQSRRHLDGSGGGPAH